MRPILIALLLLAAALAGCKSVTPGCTSDEGCPSGQRCEGGACIESCSTDADCIGDKLCVDDRCVAPAGDDDSAVDDDDATVDDDDATVDDDDVSDDDSADDDDATAQGPFDGYFESLAESYCARVLDCDATAFADAAACVDAFAVQFESLRVLVNESLRSSALTFGDDAALPCRQSFAERDCAVSSWTERTLGFDSVVFQTPGDDCDEVLEGDAAEGDDCTQDLECAGALFCAKDDLTCALGSCEPRLPENSLCQADDPEDRCDFGTRCFATSGATSRCLPQQGAGATCQADDQCAAGLLCFSPTGGATKSCNSPGDEGDPCTADEQCASGTPGAVICNSVTTACGEPVAHGGTCGRDGDCVSSTYCDLDALPRACTDQKSRGDACTRHRECMLAAGMVCNNALPTPKCELAGSSTILVACGDDSHCAPEHYCANGDSRRCKPFRGLGQACNATTDTRCEPGLYCTGALVQPNDTCQPLPGRGEACDEILRLCVDPLDFCLDSSEECARIGIAGEPCNDDPNCAWGACVGSECVSPLLLAGESCSAHGQCASFQCTGGVCTDAVSCP